MEIRGFQESQNIQPEQVDSVVESEMAAMFEEDENNKKSKKNGKKVKEKTKATGKPRSVDILNRDAELTDLVKGMAQKMAKNTVLKNQKHLEGKLKDEMVKEWDKSQKNAFQDAVTISKSATTHHSDEIKRQQKTDRKLDEAKRAESSHLADQPDADFDQKDRLKKQVQKNVKATHVAKEEASAHKTMSRRDKDQTMQRFILAYSDGVVKKDAKKKQEATNLRNSLRDNGVSTKKMNQVQTKVQRFIHKDIRKQVKDRFLNLAMSYEGKKMTPDLLSSIEQFHAVEDFAKQAGVISEDAHELKDTKNEARSELRSFISGELDRSLVKGKIAGASTKELIEVFDKFNTMAGFAKFDPDVYMRHFKQKMDDQGLSPFYRPDNPGHLDTNPDRGGGGQQRQQQEQVDYDLENREALEERLRTLIVRRETRSGFRETLDASFEIAKTRHKLKRAGMKTDELEKIMAQGEGLAKLRLTMLLREVYEERATMPQLKGTAYKLLQKRLK
ncbi:MAG: hypothetical protein ACI9BD_001099, partial [Candidatus Marinamargulisbacteria bacterium]